MLKFFVTIFALYVPLCLVAQTAERPMSLDEVLEMAREHNLSLTLAREAIATAEAEGRELNALWYPSLSLTAEYSHTLTDIAAETTIGQIGGELLGNLKPIISNIPAVESIINSPLRLSLVPRNTAEVGVEMGWVVFSGGRRIVASRLADRVLAVTNERYAATANGVVAAVTEAYWGLALARELTAVRRSALGLSGEHLRQARRLEEEGMINRAERLVAEVAYDECAVLLASAESEQQVATTMLATLLATDSLAIIPTTPLCLPHSVPTKEELMSLAEASPTMNALRRGEEIASLTLRAERSSYVPSIALIAHQQLWSSGLDKNIFPRTILGIGLEWKLFDGLAREGAIARSASSVRTAESLYQKSSMELRSAIDRCYAMLSSALNEYHAQQTTLRLAEELHRVRLRAFSEGMATSSEVVDAHQRLCEVKLAQLATLYAIDTSLVTLLMLVGKADTITTYFTPHQS